MQQAKHYSANEAAALCGVSDDTIRRRVRDGAFPRARRDCGPTGRYRIPLADLVAAGLYPPHEETGPDSSPSESSDGISDGPDDDVAGASAMAASEARNHALTDEVTYLRDLVVHLVNALVHSFGTEA